MAEYNFSALAEYNFSEYDFSALAEYDFSEYDFSALAEYDFSNYDFSELAFFLLILWNVIFFHVILHSTALAEFIYCCKHVNSFFSANPVEG